MSSFFDDLVRQLRDAARAARAAGRSPTPAAGPRWGRLRAGLRGAPVALAVAIAVGVVIGAFVLLGRGGPGRSPSPSPASPPPSGQSFAQLVAHTPPARLRQEFAYIGAASQSVLKLPACRLAHPTMGSVVHGRPERSLLSILGVLRRPATAADRVLRPSALAGVSEVYAGYVRRALVARDITYYLAVERDDPATYMPSARCFSLQVAALARDLPRIPATLRAPTQRLQRALMAYDRGLVARAPRSVLCLVAVFRASRGSNTGCGDTAAQVAQGRAVEEDNGNYVGIVPDSVASVTMTFPAAAGRAATSATATVRGNVFALRAPAGGGGTPAGTVTTWRSASGRVLKRSTQPAPMSLRQACTRHPGSCAPMTAATAAFQSGAATSTTSAGASSHQR